MNREEINLPMRCMSIVDTRRGGPEGLRVVEKESCPSSRGEVRVRILASLVCRTATSPIAQTDERVILNDPHPLRQRILHRVGRV